MIGEKRTHRSNEDQDLPSCLTGEAPSHFIPSKKQATGRGKAVPYLREYSETVDFFYH